MFDKGDREGAFGPRHLVALGWRLVGELDVDALQGALNDVVVRHEMLRTSVVRDAETPFQAVNPSLPAELVIQQLPSDDGRSRDERVDEFVNEVEAGSLPVKELPHIRAVVGKFDERDAVIVLVTHHTASDGWSLHVIIRDLATFYAARRGSSLPELPLMRQYREYAYWQQADLASDEADAARDYWREALRGAEILGIRTDRRISPETTGVYSVHRFLIDQPLTSATLEVARAMRSSPFMVLTAAFDVLLHRMTGAVDIVASTITSGRKDSSFNQTVGPFFNLVPLRTDLTGCRSFVELVRRIRATCLEAYQHELPFGEIAAVAPDLTRTYHRDDRAVCAFQVLQFPGAMEAEVIGDLEFTEVRRRTMSYPTTSDIPNGVLWGLDVLPTEEIAGVVRFNRLQFDAATIHTMVADLLGILRNGVSDPNAPLEAL
jgi:hypothetical protein